MNIKHWSKNHTIGLLIGILTPILFVPIILLIISLVQNYYLEQLWYKFIQIKAIQGKFISLSVIPNLLSFYLFLNREKYEQAMGIILGSFCFIPYIIYLVYF